MVLIFTHCRADVKTRAESAPVAWSEEQLTEVVMPDTVTCRMLEYTGFKVAFNPSMHLPNYVAWELLPHETDGDTDRDQVRFAQDTRVDGCATLQDYRKSGYDRGHMAPAADMKWSPSAMADCHFLTNICPQKQALNAGAWSTVEKDCRRWTERFGRLIIIAGPILRDDMTESIGTTPVPVPKRFFKVILAPDADPPAGIGFIMPNAKVPGGAMPAAVSIDKVEDETGYDFFGCLPDDTENEVERDDNFYKWFR